MPNSFPLDHELLRTILQSIPHGIILFDPQGEILYINNFAEGLLGFQPGEWSGSSISCMFLEEDCKIFLPNIIKLSIEEGEFEGEALLRNRQSREFFAHFTTFLYKQGRTQTIVATIQDIGALKMMQRNLAESDRLRSIGKVVDQLAHHIRNPIAAIGGFAARLLRRGLSEKDRKLYKEIIFQEANRLDELLRSLASFTALPLPSLEEKSLDRLMSLALSAVPEALQERASAWHIPPAEQLEPIRAFMDLQLLAQSLGNVITNALESSTLPMVITIKAYTKDDHFYLSVADNGEGINAADLPRVFDPLFTTKNGHVGLGLTISQRIIYDHSGKIDIESELGRGTLVTIGIPRERRRSIRVRRL